MLFSLIPQILKLIFYSTGTKVYTQKNDHIDHKVWFSLDRDTVEQGRSTSNVLGVPVG